MNLHAGLGRRIAVVGERSLHLFVQVTVQLAVLTLGHRAAKSGPTTVQHQLASSYTREEDAVVGHLVDDGTELRLDLKLRVPNVHFPKVRELQDFDAQEVGHFAGNDVHRGLIANAGLPGEGLAVEHSGILSRRLVRFLALDAACGSRCFRRSVSRRMLRFDVSADIVRVAVYGRTGVGLLFGMVPQGPVAALVGRPVPDVLREDGDVVIFDALAALYSRRSCRLCHRSHGRRNCCMIAVHLRGSRWLPVIL